MDIITFQVGNAFPQILQNMQNMGFFLYLFPFLLSLAIFFGILSIAAKDRMPKSAISLISLILSLFVMLYASWNVGIVAFFANLSGAGLIVGSVILFLIIMFGMFGFDVNKLFDGPAKWAAILIIILIVILIALGAGAGQFGLIPNWASSSEFLTIIFFVVIIALAMWFMSSGSGNSGGGGEKKP